MQAFTLDELAEFSPWVSQILENSFNRNVRTHLDVLREYDIEKWGALLAVFESDPSVGLDRFEECVYPEGDSRPFVEFGEFGLLNRADVWRRYVDHVAEALLVHCAEASALVELGTGYGALLLRLARRQEFQHLNFIGLDIAPSGLSLMNRLARRQGSVIQDGYCDLGASELGDTPIPEGSVFLTSNALMCVPEVSTSLFETIGQLNPTAVVHVEPIYSDFSPFSVHGLLCRRYIEINRYSKSIYETLRDFLEAEPRFHVLSHARQIFGTNPLCPDSIIVWGPRS
jgi:hypothetical protein